ncbi:MAG: type II toxin-antitoxin system prevent-host-death family antitoxin [Bifidobacteriaceae bacterium]|jgi:prevent-host-death family protein|nr:type II toxin-antitoxin system prevent-host-death family antitoxin [Bifidobacteriaceae bacterium]
MRTVGIRELRQNTSGVVRSAREGETVIVTQRGQAVAQITTLAPTPLGHLRAAGLTTPASISLAELGPPLLAAAADEAPLSNRLAALRQRERCVVALYLDSSALVKLVRAEPESTALTAWLAQHPAALVASALARAEVLRAVAPTGPEAAGFTAGREAHGRARRTAGPAPARTSPGLTCGVRASQALAA